MKFGTFFCLFFLVLATPAFAALPAGWFQTDIGSVGGTGTAAEVSGTYTLNDRGSQFYDQLDSGQFAYRQVTGNGVISARVATMAGTEPYAQAGVCWREGLLPTSKSICIFVTPTRGVQVIARRWTGYGIESVSTYGGGSPPFYVRITRSGYNFTPEYSIDGSSWVGLGSAVRITMIPLTVTGLATSSHDSATLRAATFDNVSSTATSSGNHFFISNTAVTGSGAGTWASPWSLHDACKSGNSITAPSTVWMRGGIYPAKLECYIAGTVGNVVNIRSYPGERAIIDGDTSSGKRLTVDVASSGCTISVNSSDYLVPGVKISVPNADGSHEDIRIINPMIGTAFNSCIRGDNGTPIQAHPSGTPFRIFDSALKIKGAYTSWWDIEITNSENNRQGTGQPYPGGDSDYWPTYRGPAYSIQATNVTLYFPIAHDAQEGLSDFSFTGLNVYGGVFFNGGTWGINRGDNAGNGHGFYYQNDNPIGGVIDSVTSVLAFATALKAGAVAGPVDYITVQNSTLGCGGCMGRGVGVGTSQFTLEFVSDGKRQINNTANNNTIWSAANGSAQAVQFGYTAANGKNGVYTNNYVLGGSRGIYLQNWQNLTAQNNLTFITNGNGVIETEMLHLKYTTQGAAAGHVNTVGTAVTLADGDRFNSSWGTGCVGCPATIHIGTNDFNIASVADDGLSMTLASSAGTLLVASYNVGGTGSHPTSLTVDTNQFYSGVGLNDQGTTGSSNQTRREYQFNNSETGKTVQNIFGSTLLRWHPDCVSATQEDRSYQRWTSTEIPAGTGIVNRSTTAVTWVSGTKFNVLWAGKTITINGTDYTVSSVPTCTSLILTSGSSSDTAVAYTVSPANASAWTDGKPSGTVIRFNQTTANESAWGYVANVAVINWNDSNAITLPAATLSAVLVSGDRYQLLNAMNWDGPPILEGVYAGVDLSVPMTDLRVRPAIGLGFVPKSSLPRFGPFILRRL